MIIWVKGPWLEANTKFKNEKPEYSGKCTKKQFRILKWYTAKSWSIVIHNNNNKIYYHKCYDESANNILYYKGCIIRNNTFWLNIVCKLWKDHKKKLYFFKILKHYSNFKK